MLVHDCSILFDSTKNSQFLGQSFLKDSLLFLDNSYFALDSIYIILEIKEAKKIPLIIWL